MGAIFSVRDSSHLSRHFHDCRVFAHRVGKIPLHQMRENASVCPALHNFLFNFRHVMASLGTSHTDQQINSMIKVK